MPEISELPSAVLAQARSAAFSCEMPQMTNSPSYMPQASVQVEQEKLGCFSVDPSMPMETGSDGRAR